MQSKPRNIPEGTWVLEVGIEIPFIYQIYGCKKENKILGQPSEMLHINSGLYIIHKHTNFIFSQKGIMPGKAYT